jgi:hypothetical protein
MNSSSGLLRIGYTSGVDEIEEEWPSVLMRKGAEGEAPRTVVADSGLVSTSMPSMTTTGHACRLLVASQDEMHE